MLYRALWPGGKKNQPNENSIFCSFVLPEPIGALLQHCAKRCLDTQWYPSELIVLPITGNG